MVINVMSVQDVMKEIPYQWPEDVSQPLGNLTLDYTSAGCYGSKGMPCLYNLGSP